MRKKLISKKEEKRKQKRNQIIVGIVLVFVMVLSAFGVAVNSFGNSEEQKITYKGYNLVQSGSYYVLSIGESNFYLFSHPKSIETLDADIKLEKILADYLSKPLYFSSENPSASQEIYQNIQPYAERIQFACLEGEECSDDNLPIKDCSNNFIIIRESEENKIYQNENCVFIEGKQEDLLTLTDKFILETIGIK